ncbi:hypothetical protein FZI91_01505 [Mycobacterium sp. CBMA271]|uniref:hypothetical protein n=1 Tax=unclassified Mycobacteroides TaxID=2618759 RepID=UPI0012DCF2E2|nr:MULTISPECIES: hypothetical protein [unclassified Mycobacteroides]MUM17813.1 hypothetical protein [Mycobacteroides sp. CBMA 326]MUM20384.1 hypothetical protein [Mycobacteroides sp. CBMA 271]
MTNGVGLVASAAVAALCAGLIGAQPVAADPPPGFPDISGLPTVDASQYLIYPSTQFTTPSGLICTAAGRNPYFGVSCSGAAVGSTSAALDMSRHARHNDSPATISTSSVHTNPAGIHALPTNHIITLRPNICYDGQQSPCAGATLGCAVVDSATTACIIDEEVVGTHGFVLSPERNWAF